ncbi:Uncharacterised protein [Shewanella putrefaciens]|nr:Uncharacterised protein [Shewanella putrefaciens]
MQASVFIAVSLDGFIASPDGDIDFLNQHPSSNPEEDFGYYAFIETVDAILWGVRALKKFCHLTAIGPMNRCPCLF